MDSPGKSASSTRLPSGSGSIAQGSAGRNCASNVREGKERARVERLRKQEPIGQSEAPCIVAGCPNTARRPQVRCDSCLEAFMGGE